MSDGLKNDSGVFPTHSQLPALDKDCCLEEIGDTMQRLVRNIRLFERDQIKVYGFTSSQCYTLLELYKQKTLTMNELSIRMNLDSSTMTRIVQILVRDGYISRFRDDDDRRIVVVSLTEQGVKATLELKESIHQFYRDIIVGIPVGDMDAVLSSVTVLMEAFEKANPNCC